MATTDETSRATHGATIDCAVSDSFAEWMRTAGGSLAVSTYQAGKVALIGWDARRGQVTVLPRQFDKPLGLAARGGRLAIATRNEVTVFADARLLAPNYPEEQSGRYDALYLPRTTFHTGDINAHDLEFDAAGELYVVNSRFCCLATLSTEYSFVPRWTPPFVSEVVPEDRCHLNGLAVVDGVPKFVTCLGETNAAGAWRAGKATGGIIVDVASGAVVTRGLSMPHSPRWHAGKLYVLNSGAGELREVNPASGAHAVVCALPGYLRGLCFVGDVALVGLCQIRERHLFGGLPVQQRYERLLCGVAAVDLSSGREIGMLEFTTGVQELYDVRFLPGVRRPSILNTSNPAGREAFTAPEFSYWLRRTGAAVP